jgi:hypothetical protein
MAAEGSEFRNSLRAANTIQYLSPLLDKDQEDVVKTACFACSNLARGKDTNLVEFFEADIPRRVIHLLDGDKALVTEAAWLLAYLTSHCDDGQLQQLVDMDLIPHLLAGVQGCKDDSNLLLPFIRTFGNLVASEDSSLTDQLLNKSAFTDLLQSTLTSDIRAIKKEALWVTSNLCASTLDHIQHLVTLDIVPTLIQLVSGGNFDIRKEAAICILNMIAKDYSLFCLCNTAQVSTSFIDFVSSHDADLVQMGIQFLNSALNYEPSLKSLYGSLMVTDALEACATSPEQHIRVGARFLLDRIYGSGNATPAMDSGANTPKIL